LYKERKNIRSASFTPEQRVEKKIGREKKVAEGRIWCDRKTLRATGYAFKKMREENICCDVAVNFDYGPISKWCTNESTSLSNPNAQE